MNGCVHSHGSVTVVPDVGVYSVALGRLDCAAICPQKAVILNSVKLGYFPALPHSVSNKPKLLGIDCNSTVCKQSFGYYCSCNKMLFQKVRNLVKGGLKSFSASWFSSCHRFSGANTLWQRIPLFH